MTKDVSVCTSGDQVDNDRSYSSVTTSSQLTMSGPARHGVPDNNARRFSNLSNLARSLPSDSSSMLQPITGNANEN